MDPKVDEEKVGGGFELLSKANLKNMPFNLPNLVQVLDQAFRFLES